MARAETINPSILAWARESAGLSLEDAASRIGISESAKHSAAEKLHEMEKGEKFPTRNQLAKFATVYRRPLITFYMEEPPPRASRGEDFRTMSFDVAPRENAMLDALLRDIRARQSMVKEILEDEEDSIELAFVGKAKISDGVQAVTQSIAEALGFAIDGNARRAGTPDDLFRELRARAEALGVFVLLVGDLGSHHHTINERVFRGFAIADKVAPFVVINDQDAKPARSFTLIHELAHIWLGETGVSGSPDDVAPATSAGHIEQFCNDVAGRFLLPDQAFRAKPEDLNGGDAETARRVIARIAESWRVSEPMVAYRFNRLGWITGPVYRALSSAYAARWQAFKTKEKEKRENDGGPSYYVVRQFKLGNALLGVVQRTLRSNQLTHTKAAKLLGVKPSSVEPLLRRFESSRGAIMPDTRR
jgi:Zn-dependent peptidase ImmA (M78 family)/transcriptional regulator with XRE-family HTH domain